MKLNKCNESADNINDTSLSSEGLTQHDACNLSRTDGVEWMSVPGVSYPTMRDDNARHHPSNRDMSPRQEVTGNPPRTGNLPLTRIDQEMTSAVPEELTAGEIASKPLSPGRNPTDSQR